MLSTATTYFEDLTATWIKEDYVDCFRAIQDASNIWPVRKRLVNYTYGKTGLIAIAQINVNVGFTGGTCSLVIRDDDGNVLYQEALTDATLTTYDRKVNPLTPTGPIIVGLEPATADIEDMAIFDIQYALRKW